MKIDKTTLKQIKPVLLILFAAAALTLFVIYFPVLTAFLIRFLKLFISLFYGIIIAYVLNIPMSWIEKHLTEKLSEKSWLKKRVRSISILLTLIFALLILIVLLSIIIPQLIESLVMLMNNLVLYIGNIVSFINNLLTKLNLEEELSIEFDAQAFKTYFDTLMGNWGKILSNATSFLNNAGPVIVNNAIAFTTALGNWFMGFMISLYLLSSKETFLRQLKKVICAFLDEKDANALFAFGHKANDIFSSFFSGQLLEACILGLLIYIGMVIFKLGGSYQLLIAVITAVTSIIPMFGAMFAMAFGFILIFATNPIQAIWFVIFYQCVQQFEGNVIYPKVVGHSVGLPGIWVLLSIVVFTGLFGLFGALIAVPLTALIYSTLSDFVNEQLKKKQINLNESSSQ